MLRNAKTLTGYKLGSIDGEIGHVEEFFFDDKYWTIRYLVANTGGWITGRQVLISPYALIDLSEQEQRINVNLTRQQVEDSPSLETDKPVSRQFEEAYYGYYGWPAYWGGQNMWGAMPFIVPNPEALTKSNPGGKAWDSHLRSTHDVTGHQIQATDGEIGHVENFIIDDETWAIRYLLVDTRDWWPGKKVLVATPWIERVSWEKSKVFVNLTRETIEQSPEYTEGSLITRDYEAALHQHYNRQGYWVDELPGKKQS